MNSTNETRQEVQPIGPDFYCENHGSVFLLIPRSASAKIWVDENLPADRQTFGDGVAIEPRYIWTILMALQDERYEVSR